MNLKSTSNTFQALSTFARICATKLSNNLPKASSLYRFRYMPIMLITGSLAQSAQAADIEMEIENITKLTGTLLWSIFDNENSYKTEGNPLVAGRSRVTAETIKVTLHDVPSGYYAIKLFHDANDNGEMDTNLLGLPQEGYGFSNNAGSFGPASFKDAKIEITKDTQITIRLR